VISLQCSHYDAFPLGLLFNAKHTRGAVLSSVALFRFTSLTSQLMAVESKQNNRVNNYKTVS